MTCVVFFDVLPKIGFADAYFSLASGLKKTLERILGFRSVVRFESQDNPGWFLSFSEWDSEDSLSSWRCQQDHRQAQICGRNLIFDDYRIRVGSLELEKNESVNFSSKNYIISITGAFTDMQLAIDQIKNFANTKARLFRAVVNPRTGIALIDADQITALKYKKMSEYQIPGSVSVYEINRDYGMFNRTQASNFYT